MAKNNHREYIKKAGDFHRAMHAAISADNWNSVGLEAVHCAISSNDAVLSFFAGDRSKKQDHKEAVKLLDLIDRQ